MATTAKGLRYPTSADTVDIAGDIQNLATDIETVHAAQTYSLTTKGTLPTRSASAYAPLAGSTQAAGLHPLASASNGLEWGAYPAAGWSLIGTVTTTAGRAFIPVFDIPLGFKEIAFALTANTNASQDLRIRTNPSLVALVSTSYTNSSRITYVTATPHGLAVGDGAFIVGTRASTSQNNGSVEAVHSTTKFTVGNASEQLTVTVAASPGDYVLNPGTQASTGGTNHSFYSIATSGAGTWNADIGGEAATASAFTSTASGWTVYGSIPEPFTAGVERKVIVRGSHPSASPDGTGIALLNINSTEPVAGLTFETSSGQTSPFLSGAVATVWGLK